MSIDESLLEEAEALQNLLVSYATGGGEEGDEAEYLRLRQLFTQDARVADYVPRFVRTSRSLHQFWGFIKPKFGTYAERRSYLWEEFNPLLTALEKGVVGSPADAEVEDVLAQVDAEHIQAAWSKALDRRKSDPEGAITMARTLLEGVCKYILDDGGVQYGKKDDLPKLYRKTSDSLNLSPSQHTEGVFKQILGGCTSVVQGLGALRNELSDAHGKGAGAPKPAARHAELAVNLAGAMAAYLLATWESRNEEPT